MPFCLVSNSAGLLDRAVTVVLVVGRRSGGSCSSVRIMGDLPERGAAAADTVASDGHHSGGGGGADYTCWTASTRPGVSGIRDEDTGGREWKRRIRLTYIHPV